MCDFGDRLPVTRKPATRACSHGKESLQMAKLGHWTVIAFQAKINEYTHVKVSRNGQLQNSSQMLDLPANSVKRVLFRSIRLT